ncbi:MAG: hypothetical protein SchgKO_06360 [Schleiferiaceae bacterium]
MKKPFGILTLFTALALTLLSSCGAAKWPNERFIKKYKYEQLVIPQSGTMDDGTEFSYSQVDQHPMYPEGMNGLIKHIQKTLKYPDEARRNYIQGKVFVSFVIEKDGYVSNVEVVRKVHPTIDAEAKRVIKTLDRFIPGYVDGDPVRFSYTVPLNFKLQ